MMKSLNLFTFRLLMLGMILAIASIAFTGCQQGGGVKEERAQQEKIATACKGITLAVNAISLRAEQAPAGPAKVKAAALAADALVIARPTADFCEPKPATYLNPIDFAALLSAAADLGTKKESAP